jgi:hypothetical protein
MGHQGRRAEARALLSALWEQVGADGDPLHRLAVAHGAADVQDDLHEELRWDELALRAADEVTDERVADVGLATSVAGLYPSLHLNLGDVHLRLGDAERARRHCDLGLAAAEALGPDPYAQVVRQALLALDGRVTAAR